MLRLLGIFAVLAIIALSMYILHLKEQNAEKRKKRIERLNKALSNFGDYTSYKMYNDFANIIIANENTREICLSNWGENVGVTYFDDIYKVFCQPKYGEVITTYEKKVVSKPDKASIIGRGVASGALLSATGTFVVATSSSRKSQTKYVSHREYTNDRFFIYIETKDKNFRLETESFKEMNEVKDYIVNLLNKS